MITVMYIDVVPNRNSRPAILLRKSIREGKKTRKQTIANLTDWPPEIIDGLKSLLSGKKLVPVDEFFRVVRSKPHGHVEAILKVIANNGLDRLIASKPCRERDLVVAMIVEQLIYPSSKLGTTRLWHSTTLAEELEIEDADEDELYAAMDWLLDRQEKIEKQLAGRHLAEGRPVFYDVSSSYYEGRTCPLARFGHNRDGKKGKRIIVYGVLTDEQGRPVSVQVYPGNTGDPSTVADQTEKLRRSFGLTRVVIVGDRGMLTQAQIDKLKEQPGLGWISSLRSQAIKKLVEGEQLQLSLFDQQNLAEIKAPDYPGERLVACFNPLLKDERQRKRGELLAATELKLTKIKKEVERRTRTPLSAVEISAKVGKVISAQRMEKHFILETGEGFFSFCRNEASIATEAALDGIYIVRTSEPETVLGKEDVVRNYKNLAQVEQLFRNLKSFHLHVRPIYHRNSTRVRSHLFISLLASYVRWHLHDMLKSLLFADEMLAHDRLRRDPVASAQASADTVKKKAGKRTKDDLPVHSLGTLLADLGTRAKLRCVFGPANAEHEVIIQYTQPTPYQTRVFDLLGIKLT